jgi:hypothetical protein
LAIKKDLFKNSEKLPDMGFQKINTRSRFEKIGFLHQAKLGEVSLKKNTVKRDEKILSLEDLSWLI